ncbi:E3 ubiquitin ligase PARAQUAT TOLERANCE 3-like isoform X2 [Malania oleifera]|uniref:E3 ubiquitin ligase PARAQUAT TOLERANCE 3-like isoform X2 n=1 Tax=Malania oleifera TaxID=397392 RepID=UPI0025ADAC80|nr:E3 ubiquitin ligase PARAQUAT TOLERANCE 3-like isoform X2 [Malania oleifera]
MAVYYKFKSAKDYDSIPIDGHFISVLNLKEKIFESKHLGRGTDFDLVVTNAQTNEEYLDEAMLIPKNTSVLIRRVPGRPRLPIVTQPDVPKVEDTIEDTEPAKSTFPGAESAVVKYTDDSDWDEFGNDLYAVPEVLPVQSNQPILDAPPPSKADEDSKIKALIDTPALDWQRQGSDGFGAGRGFGRGVGGRMMGGRGFGRVGLERKTPPQGYICHRCKVPGHFIQHCPTNGDPNYDIKRVKPPTGIPKSMLMANPDGSYALPSGAVAVLKPNEAAFEKEIEGLPSTRSVGDLPPELHCPLCKEVMKDAVLTSKCCFKSFCDKCIRDYIISKSVCVCGARNVLADDLLPNKTLRDTINRILESNNSSAENGGSVFQVQDMESARCPQPKAASPNLSAASKGEQMPPPQNEGTLNIKETTDEGKAVNAPQQTSEKGKMAKPADVSEATLESRSIREPPSQISAPLAEEEVQQKASAEAGKKKKKKKARLPINADMQWKTPQDLAAENFMMPLGPSAYNPYWSGMQPGMEGYMAPFAGPMPYMNYGLSPLDMPFGGVIPQDPFGAQGYMLPVVPPQRDLAQFGMGMNAVPPIMSREEFEARKADLRRKRENERREIERRGEMREFPKDRDFGREVSSSGDMPSMKSKSVQRPILPATAADNHRHRRAERISPERPSRDLEPPPRPTKRKPDQHHHDRDHHDRHEHHHHHRSESSARASSASAAASTATEAASKSAADRKQKASVFSRISFPAEEALSKKRKLPSSTEAPGSSASSAHNHRSLSNGYHEEWKPSSTAKAVPSSGGAGKRGAADYESSDDERHFKRKPSRYEPSPPSATEWEEEGRHSKGSRERERGGYSSKHR